jgi:hypothetical protein
MYEWQKKMCYKKRMEFYSSIKEDEMMLFAEEMDGMK